MERFQTGDVVRLKSGGPCMLITALGAYSGWTMRLADTVSCRWFEERSSKKPCLMWLCLRRSHHEVLPTVTASASTVIFFTRRRKESSLPAPTSPPSRRARVFPATCSSSHVASLPLLSSQGCDHGSDPHTLVCTEATHPTKTAPSNPKTAHASAESVRRSGCIIRGVVATSKGISHEALRSPPMPTPSCGCTCWKTPLEPSMQKTRHPAEHRVPTVTCACRHGRCPSLKEALLHRGR